LLCRAAKRLATSGGREVPVSPRNVEARALASPVFVDTNIFMHFLASGVIAPAVV
jgi:hypothetical protein